jgi:hypothetical protein
VGHCGLQFLTDFDGSFWIPINPHPEGNPPEFFYSQDSGTMTLDARRPEIHPNVGLLSHGSAVKHPGDFNVTTTPRLLKRRDRRAGPRLLPRSASACLHRSSATDWITIRLLWSSTGVMRWP